MSQLSDRHGTSLPFLSATLSLNPSAFLRVDSCDIWARSLGEVGIWCWTSSHSLSPRTASHGIIPLSTAVMLSIPPSYLFGFPLPRLCSVRFQ